jgi:hypothetical protein
MIEDIGVISLWIAEKQQAEVQGTTHPPLLTERMNQSSEGKGILYMLDRR